MRLRSTRLTAAAAAVQQLITSFSPTKLFAKGEQGVWYDPSDFNRYMQTGPELVSNGTFANNGLGWGNGSDAGGVVSFSNNEATLTNSTGTPRISSAIAFISGRRYVLTFDQTGTNSSVYSSGNEAVGSFGPGSNRIVFTATANSISIGFRNFVTGTSFSIRNVSIKELTAISTATLFQDSSGTTPVTGVEQPVGLMLDKRLGLVQGPELVSGDSASFDSSLGSWIKTGAALLTRSGGVAQVTNVTNYSDRAELRIGGSSAKWLQISVDCWVSSGSAKLSVKEAISPFSLRGSAEVTKTTRTTVRLIAKPGAGNDTLLQIVPFSGSAEQIVFFDNISVREIPGNHAFQPTATSRPVLGVHPNAGIRNIMHGSASTAVSTYWLTDQTQNGITSVKVNQGIDVDGLPFCDYRLTGTATASFMDSIYSNALIRTSATPEQSFTLSAICSRISGTEPTGLGLRIGVVEETAPGTYVGITTNAGEISSDLEAMYTATRTISTGNQVRIAFVVSLITGETIDVTYRIKAAQFEVGTARTAFQFNYSSLNVTEPGIPGSYYIKCDGIDDFMVTNNIDFTSTDKVTVFAGIRKLSDASVGVFAELGTNSVTMHGSIGILAPLVAGATSFAFRSTGSVAATASSTNSEAPLTTILTGAGSVAADISSLRVNGAQAGTNTSDQGTGNYGNYPLYLFRRAGTSLPFNGNFYGLIIRGALSSTSEIINAEAFMATRTGFTAPAIEQSPTLEVLP